MSLADKAPMLEGVRVIDLTSVVHLIGEPTGGKPASYGEVKSFLLPNSDLAVNYSTNFVPALYVPDTPSLLPDVAIPMRSADFFARHDPELAAIFAGGFIDKTKPAVSPELYYFQYSFKW